MRRPLIFACEGANLAATLHPAGGRTALMIVAGGRQTRHGSHRGFVALADAAQAAGFPTLRFDRRGVGDSDGDDPGFLGMAPDIAAAAAALRAACPQVERVAAWGLCDGATALALAPDAFEALLLANPWTRDPGADDAPDPAVLRRRYRERLADPRQWLRILSGGVDIRGALRGLAGAARATSPSPLAGRMRDALSTYPGKLLFILAERDATAQAFVALPGFPQPRAVIPAATHTFPGEAVESAMIAACLELLREVDSGAASRAD